MIENKATRLAPTVRKKEILEAAVECAEIVGFSNLRRDTIANRAGVANGLVSRYFKSMDVLKREVMRHAVQFENLKIIGQGIALRDPEALTASEELQKKAVDSLTTA